MRSTDVKGNQSDKEDVTLNKQIKNRHDIRKLLDDTILQLERNTRFLETKQYLQHGKMSVYEHCIRVAEKSCDIAWKMRLDVDYTILIRGALLHDYFLYDWHKKDSSHRLHGFFHPGKAYENAKRDVALTEIEEDIIKHHMFPLTVIPPKSKEAWIVCIADKICASEETLKRK
ncbi:MAG: HD domain-containing protein [Roseburia sp.]|jgi:uncharacterized protein|nr:HD domain-containing protein [Roseburia sp.]